MIAKIPFEGFNIRLHSVKNAGISNQCNAWQTVTNCTELSCTNGKSSALETLEMKEHKFWHLGELRLIKIVLTDNPRCSYSHFDRITKPEVLAPS